MDKLLQFITKDSTQKITTDLTALTDAIRKTCPNPDAIQAILLYGSGLWNEAKPDTIWDLYILTDDYKSSGANGFMRAAGSLLPPNVYFIESPLCCKYAIMRMDQFEKSCHGKALTPQIWARFAQPCRILYARDETKITQILAQAVITFHRKTLPHIQQFQNAQHLWTTGFQKTYAAEWRSENANRPEQIFRASAQSFEKRTALAMPIAQQMGPQNSAPRWITKFITLLRLMKASLTFHGGVDYALWKIERHSGIRVTANDFQRKYPLIGAWPLLWKIYRAGGLR